MITDWLAHGKPCLDDGLDLFPSERGALVAENTLLRRFRRYCNDLELPAGVDMHSLRRSYATHLIEDGWDAKFVQVLLSPRNGVHDVQHAGTGSGSSWWRWLSTAVHHADFSEVRCLCNGC